MAPRVRHDELLSDKNILPCTQLRFSSGFRRTVTLLSAVTTQQHYQPTGLRLARNCWNQGGAKLYTIAYIHGFVSRCSNMGRGVGMKVLQPANLRFDENAICIEKISNSFQIMLMFSV